MRAIRLTIPVILGFSLLVLAVLAAGNLRAAAPDKFYTMSAEQIGEQLDQYQGRRLMFIYASWCGYCRHALPQIMDIAREYKGAVVAVSVDEDPSALLTYLGNFPDVPFKVIIWDRASLMSDGLARFGIKDAEGIPFTALIDEYGYVKKQGVIEPSDSLHYLRGADKSDRKTEL